METADRIELVDSYLLERGFSGVVLIARGDDILLERGYGMANVAAGLPNTPDTLYPIMSVTKPFTAIAVMQLHGQGRLDVDMPVQVYLPDITVAEQITVHQLLTHTSGLPDDLYPIPVPAQSVSTAFDDVLRVQPAREPGTGYSYSNVGYQLLALLVEERATQSFDDYLRDAIFRPLGMTHTGIALAPLRRTDLPVGYTHRNGELVAVSTFDDVAATRIGAGGIYSTAGDLYRWERALHTDQLLSSDARKRMFSSGDAGFGYSWRVVGSGAAMWHTGGDRGFFSIVFRDRERDLVVIALSNTDSNAGLVSTALSYYEDSYLLANTRVFALFPVIAAALCAITFGWLLTAAHRLRREAWVWSRPGWRRLVMQVAFPLIVGGLIVMIGAEPLVVFGSWRVTALVMPAWPHVMLVTMSLLLFLLGVAARAFVRSTPSRSQH